MNKSTELRCIDEHQKKLEQDYLDIEVALNAMTNAYRRLEQLGFKDAMYCPKYGGLLEVIECGSNRIHKAHYEGQWPNDRFWVHRDGDLWPSHPVLFRSP